MEFHMNERSLRDTLEKVLTSSKDYYGFIIIFQLLRCRMVLSGAGKVNFDLLRLVFRTYI